LGRVHEDLTIEVHAKKVFPNTKKGFATLLSWVNKLTDLTVATRFVMEATGVYHEPLAYFLADQSKEVSIVLPNKISNYIKTLEVKTVTDHTCSEAIAKFGLERKLDLWQRPKPILKRLRQLVRERDQIVEERTIVKNQLHAELAEAEPNATSVVRIKKRILFLDKQENEIKDELALLAKKDAQVSALIGNLTSIPGVGLLTAVTVLAETNGFELVRNKRQLASYAGLDVREKQSGTSIKGKPKISKRGNRHLRKAMHLPALAAIRFDEHFKAIFKRLVGKHGIKMKAVVAIQRKLLELMYTLYKKNTPYNKNFIHAKNREAAIATTTASHRLT
jgi:transposase